VGVGSSAGIAEPRVVKAGNRGPFTLDGTRSFLIGRKRAVVIDPGPNEEEHVRALSHALAAATDVRILLTHGHGDHAGGAALLARALDAPVFGPPSAGFLPLIEGDAIPTDAGDLVALSTPGHTRDHLAFSWLRARALFAGDLILGRGATTWLGEYPGCVADYLAALDRVQALDPAIIYPAHGPPVRSPRKTLEVFRAHRLERLKRVEEIRAEAPEAPVEEVVRAVYGRDLPPRLVKAAQSSIEVMLHHLASKS
jgi:glyoxylase-like metal-dependent hydrolase (beta-lactamase superfamily II)